MFEHLSQEDFRAVRDCSPSPRGSSTTTSLIVGSKGQDGVYLLCARGHHVIGIGRDCTVSSQLGPLSAVDICDREQVGRALGKYMPTKFIISLLTITRRNSEIWIPPRRFVAVIMFTS